MAGVGHTFPIWLSLALNQHAKWVEPPTVVRDGSCMFVPDFLCPHFLVSMWLGLALRLLAWCLVTQLWLDFPVLPKDRETAFSLKYRHSHPKRQVKAAHLEPVFARGEGLLMHLPGLQTLMRHLLCARHCFWALEAVGELSSWIVRCSVTYHGASVFFQFSLRYGLFMMEEEVSEEVLWHQETSHILSSEQVNLKILWDLNLRIVFHLF